MNEEIRNKGWSQMEELLDREMPVKRTGLIPFYYIRAAAVAVLLLVAGMVYMGMPYFQNHESATPLAAGEFNSAEIEKTNTETTIDSPTEDSREGFSENNNPDIRDGSASGFAQNQSESGDGFSSTPSSISSLNNSGSSEDLDVEIGILEAPAEVVLATIDLEALAFEMGVDEKNSQYTPNPAFLSSPFFSPLPITDPGLNMKHMALPDEENRGETIAMIDDETLSCPSGLAIGLSWKKPSVHSLHGLGLHIGGKRTWKKSALIASIGLTKYGWFGSSGSETNALSEAWENQDPSLGSEYGFQREYAEDLISNYWEVDLEIAWRYNALPKFSVGPQIRFARVFETKIKSHGLAGFDPGFSLRVANNTDGQFLVNSYYLSAGLGLTYDFNCKWGVEFTYQNNLTHFWKEEESRNNGRGYTLGLGVKMGLNSSK